MLAFKSYLKLEESTQYHIGKGGFSKILKTKPKLKPLFDILELDASKLHFKLEGGVVKDVITFKIITNKDFSIIQQIYNTIAHLVTDARIKQGQQIDFKFGDTKIIMYSSGGRLQNVYDESGASLKQTAPNTSQQESALVFALNQHTYPTQEEINSVTNFSFNSIWHSSFVKSYNLIINNLGIGSYHYYRDFDKKKPAFLNKMTSPKYLPDSKDNWNPSDIWAVQVNSADIVSSRIMDVLHKFDNKQATIYDLNLEIEKLFEERLLIGLSIKKIEHGNGSMKTVKVTPEYTESVRFESPIPGAKFTYNPALSYIDINCLYNILGDDLKYQFRIAPRASSGDLNMYMQGAVYPQKSNWDGSVSKILLNSKTENKIMKFKLEVDTNVYGTSLEQAFKVIPDINFISWVKGNDSRFISISDLDKTITEYEVKRALCLLHFVYEIEQLKLDTTFKSLFLSSTKMNDFSSIHYKVS
jgi:hypothetical protein